MNSITLNKIPDGIIINSQNVDFDIFLDALFEYFQDQEDVKMVKDEMIKEQKGFDYDIIRGNYV